MNTSTIPSAAKPLRILIIVNLEWKVRLGAVRVYVELAEQWRAAGHQVEHFSLTEAFARPRRSGAAFVIQQIRFAQKAADFVRRNADRFDVVDALIGSISMSKEQLRFRGLLVARSVGLYRLYDRFDLNAHRRWPQHPRGKFSGKIFYGLTRWWLRRASDKAVAQADLITVPNQNESDCLHRELRPSSEIIVQPYGLTDDRRNALSAAALPAKLRMAYKKISFIGMWGARKGAHDWPEIIRRIRQRNPEARFAFLGTMVDPATASSDLGDNIRDVELVSEYSPEDLPKLLADCTVGVFPSYVEGFGLAILEQLAAGVPTVAFDIPGPRDVLNSALPQLLVPLGDVERLASTVSQLLNLDSGAYETLSRKSAEIATAFDWRAIADDALAEYHKRLPGGAR